MIIRYVIASLSLLAFTIQICSYFDLISLYFILTRIFFVIKCCLRHNFIRSKFEVDVFEVIMVRVNLLSLRVLFLIIQLIYY